MPRKNLEPDHSKPKPSQRSHHLQNKRNTNVPTGPYESEVVLVKREVAGLTATPQYERIQRIAAGLFAERGFRGVGVAELGDAVGLGRGALYYHINSKEELLFSIVVRYIESLVIFGQGVLQQEPDPRLRIRLLSRFLMQVVAQNLPEMTVCFREADALTGQRLKVVSDLHQQYQDVWSRTLREGEEKGHFRKLPVVAIKGILGMYFHSFLWFKPHGKQTVNEIADIFSDMVLRAAGK